MQEIRNGKFYTFNILINGIHYIKYMSSIWSYFNQIYNFIWRLNSVKYTILLDGEIVSSIISYLTCKWCQVYNLTWRWKTVKYTTLLYTKRHHVHDLTWHVISVKCYRLLDVNTVSSKCILESFLVTSNVTILDSRLLDAFKNVKYTFTWHCINVK